MLPPKHDLQPKQCKLFQLNILIQHITAILTIQYNMQTILYTTSDLQKYIYFLHNLGLGPNQFTQEKRVDYQDNCEKWANLLKKMLNG